MNYFASVWSASQYIHAEFFFITDGVTVTVDTRKPVTFIDYGNDYSDESKWDCYVIWVPRKAYLGAYNFCRSQEGKPFSKSGIFCFGCARLFTLGPDGGSWICSRLMCEALKTGGILSHSIDSYTVTPSVLLELVTQQTKYRVQVYKSPK